MAIVGKVNFLAPGELAPSLSVTNQEGKAVSLTDFKGQKLIVFVYSKGGSGTCLNETLNMKEGYASLQAAGYEVLGLSPEAEKAQKKQVDKRELPFDLIADPDHQLVEALGAWGKKKMYGKEYMGVIRSTFIFDEEGKLSHVIEKVKSKEHTAQILELIA